LPAYSVVVPRFRSPGRPLPDGSPGPEASTARSSSSRSMRRPAPRPRSTSCSACERGCTGPRRATGAIDPVDLAAELIRRPRRPRQRTKARPRDCRVAARTARLRVVIAWSSMIPAPMARKPRRSPNLYARFGTGRPQSVLCRAIPMSCRPARPEGMVVRAVRGKPLRGGPCAVAARSI